MNLLSYTVADTSEAIARAVELVTTVYRRSGYLAEQETSAISAHLGSGFSVTFIASVDGCAVGTISVISDSAALLPMDSIFRSELDELRAEGKVIAEVSQFAIDREALAALSSEAADMMLQDRAISLELLRVALHYGIRKGIDSFCIAVNPKHAVIYQSMGFSLCGDVRAYPSVARAPAVGLALDLKELAGRYAAGEGINMIIAEIFAHPPDTEIIEKALGLGQ